MRSIQQCKLFKGIIVRDADNYYIIIYYYYYYKIIPSDRYMSGLKTERNLHNA